MPHSSPARKIAALALLFLGVTAQGADKGGFCLAELQCRSEFFWTIMNTPSDAKGVREATRALRQIPTAVYLNARFKIRGARPSKADLIGEIDSAVNKTQTVLPVGTSECVLTETPRDLLRSEFTDNVYWMKSFGYVESSERGLKRQTRESRSSFLDRIEQRRIEASEQMNPALEQCKGAVEALAVVFADNRCADN